MVRKYSLRYIESLFRQADYDALVEISGALCSWAGFAKEKRDYGLPAPILAFVETLCWATQSIRSGAWTYYEATPITRQEATLQALDKFAPSDLANTYHRGMLVWRNEREIDVVGRWIESNDEIVNEWLWTLIRGHRQQVDDLLG